MADLLENIKQEIQNRMYDLRPAVDEYEIQETMLAILEGEAEVVATTRQRKRVQRKRAVHNGSTHKTQHIVAYLSEYQVDEMKAEARKKRIGLAKLMTRHGYVKDERGWRTA